MWKDIDLVSFDCYGTLIDWKKGVLETLVPLFEDYLLDINPDEIFTLFKTFDAEIISSDFIFYKSVLREIMKKFSLTLNINLMETEIDSLVDSLPEWSPFEDTHEVLKLLKKNYKLALITNSDRDLIDKTVNVIGLKFDYIITSSSIGTYKPSGNNFFRALESFDLPSHKVLHVAQSIYHDIVPCNELGINNVWVNRYHEPQPADELEKPGMTVSNLRELMKILA